MGGHEYRSLVLVQAASTVLVQSGGRAWYRSRDKNRYNDRYRISSVRWCRVVGVTCLATVYSGGPSQALVDFQPNDLLDIDHDRPMLILSGRI